MIIKVGLTYERLVFIDSELSTCLKTTVEICCVLSFLAFCSTHLQGRDVQEIDVWFSSSTSLLLSTGKCSSCTGRGLLQMLKSMEDCRNMCTAS